MKNKLTSLEQHYQDLVFSLEMQPDADFLADLENRLKEGPNKKRGFIFWWTLSSASTISMMLYGMMFLLPAPISNVKFQNYFSFLSNADQTTERSIQNPIQSNYLDQQYSKEVSKYLDISLELSSRLPTFALGQITTSSSSYTSSSIDTLRNPFLKPFQLLGLLLAPKQLTQPQLSQSKQTLQSKPRALLERPIELQFYSGLNFTRSYLYSDYNLVSAYDLELTASERTLQTKNFGVNALTYAGKFQWGLGIFLTHLGEQANFNYLEAELVPIAGTLNAFDTIYHPKTFSGKNDYRFIQLPLSLGYEIKNAHFSFIPKYSVAIGFRTGEQIGYYPNRNGIGLSNFFLPNVNIQHSVQAEFRANTQLCFLSISPYLNFNSVKTPPEVLSYRKYINYGINLGIGVRLK